MPPHSSRRGLCLLLLSLATGAAVAGSLMPRTNDPAARAEIEALIDRLQEVAVDDPVDSPPLPGRGFPRIDQWRPEVTILSHAPSAGSETLHELVRRGVAAVPYLIAHLNDGRRARVTLSLKPGRVSRIRYFDDYDYNARVTESPVRRCDREEEAQPPSSQSYTVTVGDLCYVILGEIVNRSFHPVRYGLGDDILVSSPVALRSLRGAVRREWGGLTRERHQAALMRDILEPDYEERRIYACLLLGYFYPEALESAIVRQLKQPRYDPFEVHTFICDRLYRASDAQERKALFDAFVAEYGEVGWQGCLRLLFNDLQDRELAAEGRTSGPRKVDYDARPCLVELYGYPKDVKAEDRPPYLKPLENSAQAEFIVTLRGFQSDKVDRALRELLHSTEDNGLAQACVEHLVGRGADADIRRYVEPRLKGAAGRRREELLNLLERLGWTSLHMAARSNDVEAIEKLIREGADVNARAANGQTPLHVAADHSLSLVVDALIKHGADLSLRDNRGQTPVQRAIDNTDLALRLVAAGAEPCDILIASLAGPDDRVKEFLSRDRTAVSARTPGGRTPLHLAAERGHVQVAETLLAHGADVNAQSNNASTPLHDAVFHQKTDVVVVLLRYGADRSAKDQFGRTPRDIARGRKDMRAIQLLESRP